MIDHSIIASQTRNDLHWAQEHNFIPPDILEIRSMVKYGELDEGQAGLHKWLAMHFNVEHVGE